MEEKLKREEAARNQDELSGTQKAPDQGAPSEAGEKDCPACTASSRTKERSAKEYRDLINRLSRIEGQIRGIRRMVESDAYCTDILIQVSAVNAALNSFSRELLSNHIRTCVAEDIREGREETLDELVATLQKLMK